MSLFTLSTLSDIPAAEWDALLPDDQPFLRHAFLLSLEDSGSVRPERAGSQPIWSGVSRVNSAPRYPATKKPFTG